MVVIGSESRRFGYRRRAIKKLDPVEQAARQERLEAKITKRRQRLQLEKAEQRERLKEVQAVDNPIIHASRHEFDPPLSFCRPQKRDVLLSAARETLGSISYKTLDGFANPLFIEPLFSKSPTSHDGSAMYAIGRQGLIAKVPLDFINGQVLVQDKHVMVDLAAWVDTLSQSTMSLTGQAGYNTMFQWWKETGQTFSVKDLPAELRLGLLELAFGFDVHPIMHFHPTRLHMNMFGPGHVNPADSYGTVKIAAQPNLNLLLVSKQVRDELRPYITDQMCKCFHYNIHFRQHMTFLASQPTQYDGLRKLELDFSHTEYIFFFKVQALPFRDRGLNLQGHNMFGEGARLALLPSLSHLFLRFAAPLYSHDPWGPLGYLNGYTAMQDWRGNYDTEHFGHWHVSCQRLLVDWILTYALDCIKHIPQVTLTGYIKNSTKEKWNNILADERRGHAHDMSAAKIEIEDWPRNELGPSCVCANRCGELERYYEGEGRRRSERMCVKFDFEGGKFTAPQIARAVSWADEPASLQDDAPSTAEEVGEHEATVPQLTRPWNMVVRGAR